MLQKDRREKETDRKKKKERTKPTKERRKNSNPDWQKTKDKKLKIKR